MAGEIVKRQHFVPRTYLKHFGEQNGDEYFINVLPRLETKEEKIFESNIKNICFQKHLYTLPGNNPEEQMLLEKFYSDNYESQYNRIYDILVNPNKKTLTDEERELIISTVVTMFYRTSRWISLHNDIIKRVYTIMYDMCQQTGNDSFDFEGIKVSIKDKTLETLIKEHTESTRPIQVVTQLDVAMKLINLRVQRDGISVFKLNCDAEFITTDNPVIATNPFKESTMPFDPQNILKLPLDNKHILYLMPDSTGMTKNILYRKELTEKMCNMEKLVANFELMNLSERFMFGTKSALCSYLKIKEVSEKPLSDKQNTDMQTFQDMIKKGKELGLL